MDLSRPFGVVTPTIDGDVLAVLAAADDSFTPGQMHRLIGRHSLPGIRLAANRLVEQGIVTVKRAGNANLYRLNRLHLAAPHIIAMARLRHEFIERVVERLASWDPAPEFAALFGSAAAGAMRPDSDIDICVVRPDPVDPEDMSWANQVAVLSADIAAWTGNDSRILELSHTEVVEGLDNEEPVLRDIFTTGVVLYGLHNYLRRSHLRPVSR